MPILIAHRGNTEGPNPERENHPDYITEALEAGFDVEIDLWRRERGPVYLGHDAPRYPVDKEFLCQEGLWLHCKNIWALRTVQYWYQFDLNYFFHENDPCTLTSKRYIWTYPGQELYDNSICVLPETQEGIEFRLPCVSGICSDFILQYNGGGGSNVTR